MTISETQLTRSSVARVLREFMEAWGQGDGATLSAHFADRTEFHSSAHGSAMGQSAVALMKRDTLGDIGFDVGVSNIGVVVDDTSASLAAYFHATRRDTLRARFGGVIVADVLDSSDKLVFTTIRLQLHWIEGPHDAFRHWALPTAHLWKPGDSLPVISSEVDAPWRRRQAPENNMTIGEELADLFFRYAWAMDHGDFDLMKSCLADDIAGEFTPLGKLEGIRSVLTTLKAFRQSWPSMQHYVRVLSYKAESDNIVRMVVGRLIPSETLVHDGTDIYGAHYDIVCGKDDGGWKIRWFEYIPGWISVPRGTGIGI